MFDRILPKLLVLALLGCASMPAFSQVTAADFAATPPSIAQAADPFVMINLSVELTQQAEAYTDGPQDYGVNSCGGRTLPNGNGNYEGNYYNNESDWGVCYFSDSEYIGYFDPQKCYVYVSGGASTQDYSGPSNDTSIAHFRPSSLANTDHTCNGSTEFSGNFMNWATMTALDEFRSAMTGGARIVDTDGASARTFLTRTHRYDDWNFVLKAISNETGSDAILVGYDENVNNPRGLTPFDVDTLEIDNDGRTIGGRNVMGNRVRFFNSAGTELGEYNVVVEVCNPGLTDGSGNILAMEENCVDYTDGTDTWYKPEGVLQRNAMDMRYALSTYSAETGNARNGGVLRSNAKYIGYYRPAAGGGLEVNPNREIDENGLYRNNPDGVTLGNGVNNSGILNYINSFGLGSLGYKGNDPISELYYEGLRYFKNLGPTQDYYSGLSDAAHDHFPVITDWEDPIAHACQKNYMVTVSDVYTHADNDLPGSAPLDEPSDADSQIDAKTLTDSVGVLEGMSDLGSVVRNYSIGAGGGGYWIAGLAYYANTQDIRSNDDDHPLDGKQSVRTFVVDTQEYKSDPGVRRYGTDNQLWMAAKYGGFIDEPINGTEYGDGDPHNGDPAGTSTDEWDRDGDGVPDAYTLASQPANLIAGLNAAFANISENISSGSAASVVTNSSAGTGAVYQGLFKPSLTVDNDYVEWLGVLHALFIDSYGNFREDTNGDGQLTNADMIIQFEYNNLDQKNDVYRYVTTDGGETMAPSGQDPVDVDELDAIWNARDELADLNDVTTQRNYTTSANNGRHILTGIDANADGLIRSAETLAFNEVNFPGTGPNNYYRYLGLDDATSDEAPSIVNYIRGEEVAGYRSRTIDYDGDGAKVWRLGDIISSSPITVGRPSERYDLRYGDDTYTEFREQYYDRRQMVYAGANDGMLHAFNAGFYDGADLEFDTTSPDGTATAHPLGSEIWAYVPFNLLPHLRWLTQVEYPHVYYVDGIPQVFEVNIFPDDATHPDGWGTILVVGLRFGGGEIDLDLDGDGIDDMTSRSSYIVMDITDPEQPPELVAEISHPAMGYSTSRPTLIKERTPDNTGSYANPVNNEWYLVMGSGPFGNDTDTREAALDQAVSNQNAKLFVFDLNTKSFVNSGAGNNYFSVTGGTNGYAGDLSAADWDRDFADDVVYFGLVQGSVNAPAGDLMRFVPPRTSSGPDFSRLVDRGGSSLGEPFTGPPHISYDAAGNYWVYAGSGRHYVADDDLSSPQHGYYGIKEPRDGTGALTYATVNLHPTDSSSELVNTSGIEVFDNGYIRDPSQGGSENPVNLNTGQSVADFRALRNAIASERGWFFEFEEPESRNVGRSDQLNVSVLFTEYTPPDNICEPGITDLNAVYYGTGTAAPFAALGTDSSTTVNGGELSVMSVELGKGLIRDIVLDHGQNRVVGQDHAGGLQASREIMGPPTPAGRVSWRELEVDWE